MTLKTALAQGAALLKDGGVDAPKLTAEILLAHALRKERVWLVAHSSDQLNELGWIHYGRYLHQRLQRKPTQYISGRQEFYGREFHVAPGVLIPRPETELLVEAVLGAVQPGRRVLDIGAGSGCIAVTLARESSSSVFATDLSAQALAIARRNAAVLEAKVSFVQCDLGAAFADSSFDVVVSNPPYVRDSELLPPEVASWEPHAALFAGSDGLDVFRRLIPDARRLLRAGGLLGLEFGQGQAQSIRQLLRDWTTVSVHRDLAGIERYCLARL